MLKMILTLAVAQSAFADYLQSDSRGREQIQYKSPYSSYGETCVLPQQHPLAKYSKKDLENEQELCKINFYGNSESDFTTAVCPKMKSTNPGLEVYKLKANQNKKQFESSDCYSSSPNAKKIAKFKQSITCSYAPSIVGYYHLSRILDAGNVPVSVVRTMSQQGHAEYVKLGASIARKKMNPASVIYKAWVSAWPAAHSALGSTIKKGVSIYPEKVFSKDLREVYGALSVNPRGEQRYKDVYGSFRYDTRYQTFMRQAPYQMLSDGRSIDRIIGTDFKTSIAKRIQLKDVSDMIILDLIMSQQDRPGNIHYINVWAYQEDGKVKTKKVKYDDNDNIELSQKTEMQQKGGVVVKQMVLKDNDCGVAKDNLAKKYNWLGPIKHMSKATYDKFMEFEASLSSSVVKSIITQEWLFTAYDYKKLAERSSWLKSELQRKVNSGELKLDL